MDGLTGSTTATAEEPPDVVAVMDPLLIVRPAGDALDVCRRRVHPRLHRRRDRKSDPQYRARRTPHTGACLLTNRQQARLEVLFAVSEHVEVEATWGAYRHVIAAYWELDRSAGRTQ